MRWAGRPKRLWKSVISELGRPVLIGPHTYNFADAARLAVESGAALRVAEAEALSNKLQELFANAARLDDMGRAGMAFVRENQGATAQAMRHIGECMKQNSCVSR